MKVQVLLILDTEVLLSRESQKSNQLVQEPQVCSRPPELGRAKDPVNATQVLPKSV